MRLFQLLRAEDRGTQSHKRTVILDHGPKLLTRTHADGGPVSLLALSLQAMAETSAILRLRDK